MARLIYKLIDPITKEIPVDEWDTEKFPMDEQDRLFKHIRGEIIIPMSSLFMNPESINEETKQIDYFAMNSKRAYNSDDVRNHICRYLNYFEKFYDTDKELLSILFKIKLLIDYTPSYSIDNLMEDINRYIIRNFNLTRKIRRFVDDNYKMKLSTNNNRTPNLQFNNEHAKVLYEISLMTNIYIPLATHYMYIHGIKTSYEIQRIMLSLFDLAMAKFEDERGIYIYDKLYEMATSVTNKSIATDRVLWNKNLIRGNNPTTHIHETVNEIILQILCKYTYTKNIVNFGYFSARQSLKYKIVQVQYEMSFTKLSASKRDSDQNSEFDRFESRISKRDEALAIQNKVSAEQTVNRIVTQYGPIPEDEIEFYRKRLTLDGSPLIHGFQMQLIGYMFYKDFGDSTSFMSIQNTDYIKLIICAKRILKGLNMVILPYILSSKVMRTVTRKILSKKDTSKYERSQLYEDICHKYNNDERILNKVWELIGMVATSAFEIIDYDEEKHCAGQYDKCLVPMINDIIYEEMLFFIVSI